MNAPLIWVIGAGGLLGSYLKAALSRRFPQAEFWQSAPRHFSWTDPAQLMEELSNAVASFATDAICHEDGWALLWCAGKGTVSSPTAELQTEWFAWSRLLDLMGRTLLGPVGQLPGHVFLASSAGGVYGGNVPDLLTEQTPPRPNSDYGVHKLRMEVALRDWAHSFENVSTLIARISTLYGPGQDLRKRQGIISHLSRCLIHRQRVSIYVPLDTRRDYLFVGDCAHEIAACFRRLAVERPRLLLKIFASERPTCLAEIISIFFRISKHHPLIAVSQGQSTQSTSLKLRSGVWRDLNGLRRTDLAVGIHLLHAHQLALFQRGLLPAAR
jgi:UDP-glucose 4-epimerase